RSARAALQDAVMRMEHARGPARRRDPHEAVSNWRALVGARWSLLDQFESNGKRYIVAVTNEPFVGGDDCLAPREKQVLAAAAAGRTNKVIAYELGVADSPERILM